MLPLEPPLGSSVCIAILDCYRIDELDDEGLREPVEQNAIVLLQLPPLISWLSYDCIRIRRGDNCAYSRPGDGNMIFYPTEDSSLFAFDISHHDEQGFHTLIVPADSLLALLRTCINDVRGGNNARAIEERDVTPVALLSWSLWGHNTRYMGNCLGGVTRSICGSRCATKEIIDDKQVVVLYDFASIPALLEDVRTPDLIPTPRALRTSDAIEVDLYSGEFDGEQWNTKLVPSAPCRRVVTDIVVNDQDYIWLYNDGIVVRRAEER